MSVDGVLCISLENRDDRRTLLASEFEGTDLAIEFYLAQRDADPERGCFESHQACARIALARGYDRVLLLEDDATLEQVSRKQISRINRFLTLNDPELFYLGTTLGTLWLTWNLGIARCRVRGTHAYILNKAGCEKLAAQSYEGIAIDKLFSRLFRGYCSFPMLCQQQPEEMSYSDIAEAFGLPSMTSSDWQTNWRKQYRCALKNIGKTIIRKDL